LGADAYFDFDRASLKPAGRAKLDRLSADLRRVASVSSILIVGNTDSKGTEEYNFRLGQRRADSVANYLVSRGVPASLISTQSRGELDPVAPNTLPNGRDNPAGRALNRRVVITVTAQEKVISR
jgi:OOP family OmpA-OmpF porin